MSYSNVIRAIKTGDPVSPSPVNRALLDLLGNTNYLKDLVDAALTGQTVFARAVTVDSSVVVGTPVFYNAATQRFEAALAAAEINADTGVMGSAASAHAWGVVYTKHNSTLADLLLLGYAPLNIAAAVSDATVASGLYYLSGTTPGKMTRVRPAIGVPILRAAGNGHVFVNSNWADILNLHTHLQFDLRCQPAGVHVPPAPGGTHTISSPDVDVQGWLPAAHSSFSGLAPAGARFGYNLRADAALQAAWPPIPASYASLDIDGVAVPAAIRDRRDGKVLFDRNGIWWMSDLYNEVPWPTSLNTTGIDLSEVSDFSDTNPGEYDYKMTAVLYFTKLSFFDDATAVTGLRSDDRRVKIYCQNGDPHVSASVGPLEIKLDLQFLVDPTDAASGYMAFKGFDPATQTFSRGPVASGVYSKTAGLTISGNASYTKTISSVSRTVHVGEIGLDLAAGDDRELLVQLVDVSGGVTEERTADNVLYLAFPSDEETSLRGRLHVPATLNVASPQIRLNLRVLGPGVGTLPNLTLTMRRIPKTTGTTQASLPASDSSVALTSSFTTAATNKYLDVQSSAFSVAAGDDVLFTLTRTDADSYNSDVGILRMTGLIESGA